MCCKVLFVGAAINAFTLGAAFFFGCHAWLASWGVVVAASWLHEAVAEAREDALRRKEARAIRFCN